jgi:hypothetical protein
MFEDLLIPIYLFLYVVGVICLTYLFYSLFHYIVRKLLEDG